MALALSSMAGCAGVETHTVAAGSIPPATTSAAEASTPRTSIVIRPNEGARGTSTRPGASTPSPSSPSTTATAAPAPGAAQPDLIEADAPILQVHSICYGECGFMIPDGLASVVVYADGEVVSYWYDDGLSSSSGGRAVAGAAPWRAFRRVLPEDELGALVATMRRAHLDAGGVDANGTTEGTADGGGTIFVARLDGRVTTIEAPFLGDDSTDFHSRDREQRARLEEIQRLFVPMSADPPAGSPAPIEDWALTVEPSGPQAHGVQRWDGDLSTVGEGGARGGRCAILAGDALVAHGVTPGIVGAVSDAVGRSWSASSRPRLPHERTCADVSSTNASLRSEELARLVNAR